MPAASPNANAEDALADSREPPRRLVAEDARQRRGDLALRDVQVGAADAAGLDGDRDLAGAGLGDRRVHPRERGRLDRGRAIEAHRPHAPIL
jgi:hypothetical protein